MFISVVTCTGTSYSMARKKADEFQNIDKYIKEYQTILAKLKTKQREKGSGAI